MNDVRYNSNGQTRKSGGYAVSTNGGQSFSKPNYPQNKIVDTSSPILLGIPSGEGDISVILRGQYYYMFFQNVEQYCISYTSLYLCISRYLFDELGDTGVARAARASEAYPGSFQKYLNGQWNSPCTFNGSI